MIQMQQKLDSTVTDWSIQYFVKFSVSVKDGNQKGDWVLLWGNISSENKSGKTITVPFNSVFKIEDEKIAMEVDYYDNMSIVKQLGYTITPPTEGQ
jgi:limonene-1,2-epoxide hydrolase